VILTGIDKLKHKFSVMEERWIKCLLCGDKGEKLRYKNKNVCYCVCVLRKLKEKKRFNNYNDHPV
jgi:hypothetical protein